MKCRAAISLLFAVVAGLASVSPTVATPGEVWHDSVAMVSRHVPVGKSAHLERIYDKAWLKIRDNYVARDKLADWDDWRHKFDKTLTNKEQLVDALNQMVDSLHDDYTYVLTDEAVTKRSQIHSMKNVVHSRLLDHNIGYIKLDNFSSDNAVPEFRRALKQLQGSDAYVLDLRNNHGGFIDTAHHIFSMLADRGLFMTYVGYEDGVADMEAYVLQPDRWQLWRNGEHFDRKRSPEGLSAKPLLVLVNQDTRSAAELLAGSLRDGGKAMVLGTKTYGKGVLQDAYDLGENIFLKVTTAKYFLPSGVNIHGKGINPDVVVVNEPGTDTQLITATTMLHSAVVESRRTGARALAVIEEAKTRL